MSHPFTFTSSLTLQDRRPIYAGMSKAGKNDFTELIKEWTLPPTATLGSPVRAKGILLDLRARLHGAIWKSLDIETGVLTWQWLKPTGVLSALRRQSYNVLQGFESLPMIPREIADILTITTTERHRWLNDGRLPSAGTPL